MNTKKRIAWNKGKKGWTVNTKAGFQKGNIYGSLRKTGKNINCIECNKQFYAAIWEMKRRSGRNVCSQKCYQQYWNKHIKSKFQANAIASNTGRPSWNNGTKGIMKINKGSFQKGHSMPKGKDSSAWKGGVTPINRQIRASLKYRMWRKAILQRDNFVCQVCDEGGGKLRANHIKKFADYPELRLVLTNGITIHESCDLKYIVWHEEQWESYFNFNLMTRGFLN